ncbi:MAG: transposase family protein [Verrucomicrobiae bacterium]|nr:transposase family protein [Verrucomicrobiae bacterium]
MSQIGRTEYLQQMRERTAGRGRKGRGEILNGIYETLGLSRKHAIKLMNGQVGLGKRRRGGPRRQYGEAKRRVLKQIWLGANQPCGKLLRASLRLWLPFYEKHDGGLEESLRRRIERISAASIDRLLRPCRVAAGKRARLGTRPGTLLRTQIPVRLTFGEEVHAPGWLEADTVAHCGDHGGGDYVWSITFTDIHTQWTEARACFNRGQAAVLERVKELERELPFPILGFDSDNGGEFLNHHLATYFLGRKRPVSFTRSRPHKKNDNAHVEQKNWSHVRQLVGYARLEHPEQARLLNELYRHAWNPWRNFFCPVMKLQSKTREGARWVRRYDPPQTPFERLKASNKLDHEQLRRLEKLRSQLDPFTLKAQIEERLRRLARLSSRFPKRATSSPSAFPTPLALWASASAGLPEGPPSAEAQSAPPPRCHQL